MEEELKYTSKFNGEDTDSILEGAKKVINAELPSLDEIGGFMVYDKEGKAIGLMSSEQVAQVSGRTDWVSKRRKEWLNVILCR